MNAKTVFVSVLILVLSLFFILTGIFGTFLPENVNAEYVRQSAAQRQVEGGGTSFGK